MIPAWLGGLLTATDLSLVAWLLFVRHRLHVEQEAYDELLGWAQEFEPYVMSQTRVLLTLEAASRLALLLQQDDGDVVTLDEVAAHVDAYIDAFDAIPRSAFQRPGRSEEVTDTPESTPVQREERIGLARRLAWWRG